MLVDPKSARQALTDVGWLGHNLGNVEIWNGDEFGDGLTSHEQGIEVEFFVQVRKPSGANHKIVEISQPFLWYWDAYPVANGWAYVNRAGREQPLIRYDLQEDSWSIEIKALEFRQFLAATGKTAVMQLDIVLRTTNRPFTRVDDEFETDWAHLNFHVSHKPIMGDRPAFSRLRGQYLISGMRGSRVPRFLEHELEPEYAKFVYGVDRENGQALKESCDPKQLGTYFDKDNSRLHYLTPIYFSREVLQPYVSEPTKYVVSASGLGCLDLWSVRFSFNTAGLVEVYLGDLGRDLPADEWGHWLTYNVPPRGQMDEGRFRRDFLNQWATSKDHVGDLRNARIQAAQVSNELLGAPLWKPLSGNIEAEFRSLIGPLNDDPAALGHPVLTLTKALVDGIDPGPLKSYLKDTEKGDQSLQLLRKFEISLGASGEITAILRDLQSFRSKGGIAHLGGSGVEKAATQLGIMGLSPTEAFESIITRATLCLMNLTEMMSLKLAPEDEVHATQ